MGRPHGGSAEPGVKTGDLGWIVTITAALKRLTEILENIIPPHSCNLLSFMAGQHSTLLTVNCHLSLPTLENYSWSPLLVSVQRLANHQPGVGSKFKTQSIVSIKCQSFVQYYKESV